MGDLDGKVALVTGGSRGIGAAIAKRLGRSGADVALTYLIARKSADEVASTIERAGRRSLTIQADSGDASALTQAVDRTVAELGGLDILVNNAGFFPVASVDKVPLEELDRTLAIHVRAPFVAIQAAARWMRPGGRIITIGSCFVDRVPYPGVSLYAMSKSALVGLTKGVARDLGERGITVNIVGTAYAAWTGIGVVGVAAVGSCRRARTRCSFGWRSSR
jgi:3-oxoacyl-[acyl-carrier protein] reductase